MEQNEKNKQKFIDDFSTCLHEIQTSLDKAKENIIKGLSENPLSYAGGLGLFKKTPKPILVDAEQAFTHTVTEIGKLSAELHPELKQEQKENLQTTEEINQSSSFSMGGNRGAQE